MWKSPITIMQTEMQTQLEGEVLKAVMKLGVMVDKEELLRALQYDREQYYRGYNDAVDEFTERLFMHLEELNCEAWKKNIRDIAECMRVGSE